MKVVSVQRQTKRNGISSTAPTIVIIGSIIVGLASGVVLSLATFGIAGTTTIIMTATTTESAEFFQQPTNLTLGSDSTIVDVIIGGDTFSPQEITVMIGVNNTVMWTNSDSDAHTATASNGSFDSGILDPGQSLRYTFTRSGTYDYSCQIHPWMQGVVIVKSA